MKFKTMPMRVLFVTPDLFGPPGGIARFSRLCCKALAEAPGVELVDVIALNDRDQRNASCTFDSTKVAYCAGAANKARFMQQLLQLSIAKRDYNVYFATHVNLTTALWPLHQFNHKHSALVAVAHGIDVWSRLPWLRRLALSNASVIFAVSQLTQSRMVQANRIDVEKVRILHNCLDPSLTAISLAGQGTITAPLGLKSPSILTVSRLSLYDRYKGHTQVIQALALVQQQIAPLHYYVVGEGELKVELQQLCQKLGVATSVHFLGQVDELTLKMLYQHADLFVMPSRGEGFGLVFLEAMAWGTPVIAGNQDAAVEVVQHGETGLLVDPDNVSELAQSILRLIRNEDLRKKMGEAGRQLATAKFSYAHFCNTLLAHLQEALSSERH